MTTVLPSSEYRRFRCFILNCLLNCVAVHILNLHMFLYHRFLFTRIVKKFLFSLCTHYNLYINAIPLILRETILIAYINDRFCNRCSDFSTTASWSDHSNGEERLPHRVFTITATNPAE